jgi:hypothetical protein
MWTVYSSIGSYSVCKGELNKYWCEMWTVYVLLYIHYRILWKGKQFTFHINIYLVLLYIHYRILWKSKQFTSHINIYLVLLYIHYMILWKGKQFTYITVFTVFRLLTDFVCLYNYEFGLSLCKIVRSSVILLLPLFHRIL